jgi:two-component sensor histidine kinase
MLAVVASSNAPVLLLDGELKVIEASLSFCKAFQIDLDTIAGNSIFDLGQGEWNAPRLKSLLSATVTGMADVAAYEIDLVRPKKDARRLVLNATKLEYGEADKVRLLLTISDVTEARLAEKIKDDLVRDKAVLLQEVQHRVANSLQIIASVLMQSARRVQSEETRLHLKDAHNRVMSIAAVQQQLASSKVGDVQLRLYFTQLCQSLGASMIRDHNQILLDVETDESVTTADASVSLGLIVTELVINALKHAFPDSRKGKIVVGYHSGDGAWALSVKDDGVGMPPAATPAKAGLGTSIVEALARQLEAEVDVADNQPGTAITVVHKAVIGHQESEPALAAV